MKRSTKLRTRVQGPSRAWRRQLTGVHFHDLRHTGNHIAGNTGASLQELMGRMGHSTARAALIYQHRACDQALRGGAGDENRTRTISLGSAAITAASGADLRGTGVR